MTPKQIAAGIAAAGVIVGGGSVTADHMIDPYTSNGTVLEKVDSSAIPEAGLNAAVIDTTKPELTLKKWGGEVAMAVTYAGIKAAGARPFLSKNVEWRGGAQTMQVVPLDKSAALEDGGYEVNIILDAPPASNVFNFSISGADDLDFFYQSPLWQEAGLKAPTTNCTDTDCDIDGHAHRPEDVVGSYAVYYKHHRDHINGHTNYATGKAYHIFRPKVTDAAGHQVWASMSYDAGVLRVAVPAEFLASAEYPVTVDPTFGYTTIAITEFSNVASQTFAHLYTLSQAGTVTLMSTYFHTVTGPYTAKALIYSDSAGAPNALLATSAEYIPAPNVSQWNNVSISATLITADYHLAWITPAGSAAFNYLCDSGSATQMYRTTDTYSAPASTYPGGATTAARQCSIYATYTASASFNPVMLDEF